MYENSILHFWIYLCSCLQNFFPTRRKQIHREFGILLLLTKRLELNALLLWSRWQWITWWESIPTAYGHSTSNGLQMRCQPIRWELFQGLRIGKEGGEERRLATGHLTRRKKHRSANTSTLCQFSARSWYWPVSRRLLQHQRELLLFSTAKISLKSLINQYRSNKSEQQLC